VRSAALQAAQGKDAPHAGRGPALALAVPAGLAPATLTDPALTSSPRPLAWLADL